MSLKLLLLPNEMKLLFDQNLSHKLVLRISDIFPGSSHVSLHELSKSDDYEVREFAIQNDFTIVTQDSDFFDIAIVKGIPPKFIWLKSGNSSTKTVEKLLLGNELAVLRFKKDKKKICLELF